MPRFILAAVLGLIAGVVVAATPKEMMLASATALIVASVFFCEATILHKLEDTHETPKTSIL